MLLNNFVWVIVIILIVFLFILLLLDIKIEIHIIKVDEDDEISMSFSILRNLLRYQINVPIIDMFASYDNIIKTKMKSKVEAGKNSKLVDNKSEDEFNIKEIKIITNKIQNLYKKYYNISKYIMERITINNINWETKIGLEDASVTAIVTGVLWGLKSIIILYFKNKLNFSNINLNVTPHYVSKKFDMTFNCIVTLKIGYIIYASIKFFLTIIKGGDKYERTSN